MKYEVLDLVSRSSHGCFDSMEEAKGCVSYDRLKYWEIWSKHSEEVLAYCDPGVDVVDAARKRYESRKGKSR